MAAPAVGRQADDVHRDQADKRGDLYRDDGDFSTRAIDLQLELFTLHGLGEHGIRFAFAAIGKVIFGAIVCENLVSNTLAVDYEAMGEAEDDKKQGDSAGRERKRDLQNAIRF